MPFWLVHEMNFYNTSKANSITIIVKISCTTMQTTSSQIVTLKNFNAHQMVIIFFLWTFMYNEGMMKSCEQFKGLIGTNLSF